MFRRLSKSRSVRESSAPTDFSTPPVRPLLSWAVLILATAARTALVAAACLLFWAAVPALWGWTPTTVSSDSMAPHIRTGDVIISMPVDRSAVEVGQVLLVESPDHPGQLRLHRMVGSNDAGELITKGDANPIDDSTPVARSAVRGVAVLRVPYVGLPGFWLRQGDVGMATVFAAGAIALLALGGLGGVSRKTPAEGERRRSLAGERRGRRGRRTMGTLAVVVIAGGALAATVVPSSSAAFSGSTPNPAQSFHAASAFDCFSTVPANSPFLYYRFSETSGTSAADSSTNGHVGTLHGGATHLAGSCLSASSPALVLDGSTGYVSTPTQVSSPETFSLEMWFKTSTRSGGRLIGFGNVQAGTSSQFDRHVYMTDSGQLMFGVYVFGFYTVTSPLSYNNGNWHHMVASLSAAGLHLYVDGTQVASNTGVATGESDTGYWRIGYDSLSGWPNAPASDYFAGTIDDAAVYMTSLSGAQISAHHTEGRL